jgi:serine/threonine protein kinase
MPNKPSSSTPRRTGQDVLAELVTGFRRLVLSRDIDLGQKIGLGGYADVYEGELKIECTGERKKVALKCFRFMVSKEKEFAKVRRTFPAALPYSFCGCVQMFAREMCVWARLDHENVLSLVGIVTIDGMPALASEWMENGTMNEYLKTCTGVNVLILVRETIIS